MTLSVRSRIAKVVPTGAWLLMSDAFKSPEEAKRLPSSTI